MTHWPTTLRLSLDSSAFSISVKIWLESKYYEVIGHIVMGQETIGWVKYYEPDLERYICYHRCRRGARSLISHGSFLLTEFTSQNVAP